MSDQLELVAVVGSLRAESVNRQVFETARDLMPRATRLSEARVAQVPLFNEDIEAEGDPEAVADLKKAVTSSDALLFFTPEYNGSIPAVTKNAVDWLSRPPGDGPLNQKAVGIVVAAPGRGGRGVRAHLAASVSRLSDSVFDPAYGIVSVHHQLSQGRLVDDAAAELATWLQEFCDFVRAKRLEADG